MQRDDAGAWEAAHQSSGDAFTKLLPLLCFAGSVSMARVAWACPSCEAGIQARSEVWDSAFGANLLWMILPFLLMGCISMCANKIGRPLSPTSGSRLRRTPAQSESQGWKR